MFPKNLFLKKGLRIVIYLTATFVVCSLTFLISPEKTNAQSIETRVNGTSKDREWVYASETLEVDLRVFDKEGKGIPSAPWDFDTDPSEPEPKKRFQKDLGETQLFKRAKINGSKAIFISKESVTGVEKVTFSARVAGNPVLKDFEIEVRKKPILRVPKTISFYAYEKDDEVELEARDSTTHDITPIEWKFAKTQEEGTTETPYKTLDTKNFKVTIEGNKLKVVAAGFHEYEEEQLRKGKIIISVDDEDRFTEVINIEIKPLENSLFMGKLVRTFGWRRTGHQYYDYFAMGGDAMIFLFIAALILIPSIIWKGAHLYWWIFLPKTGKGRFLTSITRAIRPGEWKNFLARITNYVEKGDFKDAADECQEEEHPVTSVLKAAIDAKVNNGNVEKEIEKEYDRQEARLRKWLWAFDTIIAIAPMLGFLGTITGLILAFKGWMADLASGREVDMANLAGGMYQAMVTTFAGLFVAIYAMFFSRIYERRVEKLSAAMVEFGNKVAEFESQGEVNENQN